MALNNAFLAIDGIPGCLTFCAKGLMLKNKLPAHLIERDKVKLCSECGMKFPSDVEPSLSREFAAHILEAHGPVRKPSASVKLPLASGEKLPKADELKIQRRIVPPLSDR